MNYFYRSSKKASFVKLLSVVIFVLCAQPAYGSEHSSTHELPAGKGAVAAPLKQQWFDLSSCAQLTDFLARNQQTLQEWINTTTANEQKTLLHLIVARGPNEQNLELFKLLVSKGANLELADRQGKSITMLLGQLENQAYFDAYQEYGLSQVIDLARVSQEHENSKIKKEEFPWKKSLSLGAFAFVVGSALFLLKEKYSEKKKQKEPENPKA